jgi:hypothetical protein
MDRVLEVYDMTDQLNMIRAILSKLDADAPGNYDIAEAVWAGLEAAVTQLKWRTRVSRAVILLGDGPPHGAKGGAQFDDRYDKLHTTVSHHLEVTLHYERTIL